jgi:hypothetical protein
MRRDDITGIDNILCVVVTNNPTEGNFFKDPGMQSPQIFSSERVRPLLSLEQVAYARRCLCLCSATAQRSGRLIRAPLCRGVVAEASNPYAAVCRGLGVCCKRRRA